MCDAATCLAMTLGPPLVRVDALSELAATLAALAHDPSARPSSTSSLVKEALDAATDGALANTWRALAHPDGAHPAAIRGRFTAQHIRLEDRPWPGSGQLAGAPRFHQ